MNSIGVHLGESVELSICSPLKVVGDESIELVDVDSVVLLSNFTLSCAKVPDGFTPIRGQLVGSIHLLPVLVLPSTPIVMIITKRRKSSKQRGYRDSTSSHQKTLSPRLKTDTQIHYLTFPCFLPPSDALRSGVGLEWKGNGDSKEKKQRALLGLLSWWGREGDRKEQKMMVVMGRYDDIAVV